jgi:hypothetical protein
LNSYDGKNFICRIDEEKLYKTLYHHLDYGNYQKFNDFFKLLNLESDQIKNYFQIVSEGLNKRDENSVKKTLMVLTIYFEPFTMYDFEPFAPLTGVGEWICTFGMKEMINPDYEPIILSFLRFFFENTEMNRDDEHVRALTEVIKRKSTISQEFLSFFEFCFDNADTEIETLDPLMELLKKRIYEDLGKEYYSMFCVVAHRQKYPVSIDDLMALVNHATENHLKNDEKEWDIEKFNDPTYLEMAFESISENFKSGMFPVYVLNEMKDRVDLKIKNKVYDDWKYITAGIRSFSYVFKNWDRFLSKTYDIYSWIVLILSKLGLHDFVTCSVLEFFTYLSQMPIFYKTSLFDLQDEIIDKISPLIKNPTNSIAFNSIKCCSNLIFDPSNIKLENIKKITKGFTDVLKIERDLMQNDSHHENLISILLHSFRDILCSTNDCFDKVEVELIVKSIYESTKFDEIELKYLCLLVLLDFNSSKEYNTNQNDSLLFEVVKLKKDHPYFSFKIGVTEAMQLVQEEIFGDELDNALQNALISFFFQKKFPKYMKTRNSPSSFDIHFNFK